MSNLSIVTTPTFSLLAMWNLPSDYQWGDVVRWVQTVLSWVGLTHQLQRIVRTNEDGTPVFWLKFKKKDAAVMFRGVVSERRISKEGPLIHCFFVLPSDFAGANGRSSDCWTPHRGLSHGRPLDSPYSDRFCRLSITSPELRDRLSLGPLPFNYVRPTRGHCRRVNQRRQ
ncbi:hypothetical protein BDN70DRAFT_875213 [Pholiota conissans]|uniref:Uncharacterized protein n=1 Tax=Pholiota conissans TaxID=109636 RepID=A0A9P5Z796_9AGAR|nr:hypothetical protein BDN70DRAFT_875213 [Pholiota conissans]